MNKLRALICFAVAGLIGSCAAASRTNPELMTLKEIYRTNFLIGAAINRSQFFEEDKLAVSIIKTQFDSISPENILKWECVHPHPDQYDFAGPDRYVKFGAKNHMFVIGHTLVDHNQIPPWVFKDGSGKPVDRDTLLKRMHDHISTVIGRYKGQIKGWDVVNEALNEDGSLRNSEWKQIIGEDYIVKAYQFAHEADPNVELYYNDYSLENKPKRDGAIVLIQKLQSQGVKISAVGLQGHYKMNWPSTAQIEETIAAFAKAGVKVNITELDISVLPAASSSQSADSSLNFALQARLNPYTNGLPASVQQQLAERYAGILGAILKQREHVQRVTFWGVTDGDSWLNDWPMQGRTDYPLLFDRNYQPKPAFFAVVRCTQTGQQASVQGQQTLRSN